MKNMPRSLAGQRDLRDTDSETSFETAWPPLARHVSGVNRSDNAKPYSTKASSLRIASNPDP